MNAKQKHRLRQGLLIGGIILIAFNLRPGLAAVGPLISAIRIDTGLSNALLGLLTSLPLLAFGVISMFTSLLTRRWGIEATLAGALVLLTVGTVLRVFTPIVALFAGTLLIGIGIALGNVLLPSLIKRDFPDKKGIMTSLYSGMLGIGATLAAGVSIPLAEVTGWRWSLGAWALPAVIALILWLPQLKFQTRPKQTRTFPQSLKKLGNSSLAWQVAFFMGLQSLAFYVILAWLPEILQSRGMSALRGGWMLSLSQGMGVLGSLLIPTWAEKFKKQHSIIWALTIMELISLIGLIIPSAPLVAVWVSLIGFSLGGSFGLALLFIVLRTSDTETATELSGLAQSIGYLLAAGGPALFGLLHDFSNNWIVPLLMLFVVLFAKLIFGLGAARPREI
ncbi:MAG: MFS transporter [Balneolaceae bacterium]|nr:MFS transporter [Balneolaceae bacterium]